MRGREIVEPLVTRLTKAQDPIRVDWVDLAKAPGLAGSPGRLGMTFLPGKKGKGLSRDYDRDLVRDVRWLRRALGVDAFLLLVEDDELSMFRVPNIAEVMAEQGIELIRFPIDDTRVPMDRPALGSRSVTSVHASQGARPSPSPAAADSAGPARSSAASSETRVSGATRRSRSPGRAARAPSRTATRNDS